MPATAAPKRMASTSLRPSASASAGCGNCSTRNTWSSTMMPVQRMRGVSREDMSIKDISLKDSAAVLDEAANEMMGDGDRRRRGQAVGMAAVEHQRQFVTRKPACVLDLAAVDDDLVRQRLRVAADHQRAREWPWLRHGICDLAAVDAGFLQHLAPHRFLDRFARLGEPGQRRPHGWRKTRRTAEHAALA